MTDSSVANSICLSARAVFVYQGLTEILSSQEIAALEWAVLAELTDGCNGFVPPAVSGVESSRLEHMRRKVLGPRSLHDCKHAVDARMCSVTQISARRGSAFFRLSSRWDIFSAYRMYIGTGYCTMILGVGFEGGFNYVDHCTHAHMVSTHVIVAAGPGEEADLQQQVHSTTIEQPPLSFCHSPELAAASRLLLLLKMKKQGSGGGREGQRRRQQRQRPARFLEPDKCRLHYKHALI